MTDDLAMRMAEIEESLALSYPPEGTVERVLMAAIYRDVGGLRQEVLTQTRADAFFPGPGRMLYLALRRMVDQERPLESAALWDEVLIVAGQQYPLWWEEEQPLQPSAVNELRIHFDDMISLTPTTAHVTRALQAYLGRSERLEGMYSRFDKDRKEKRDKRLRGEIDY